MSARPCTAQIPGVLNSFTDEVHAMATKASSKEQSDFELKWGLLVADAWADEALKKRLLTDPVGVFKERGIEVPPGAQVKVVEDSPQATHYVLPAKPSEEQLSEEELATVAGGHCGWCYPNYCWPCYCEEGSTDCAGCFGCSGCGRCRSCGGHHCHHCGGGGGGHHCGGGGGHHCGGGGGGHHCGGGGGGGHHGRR